MEAGRNKRKAHASDVPTVSLVDPPSERECSAPCDPKQQLHTSRVQSRQLADSVLKELGACPDPRLVTDIPNYFRDGKLCDELLPAHLKGFNMDMSNSHLTQSELCHLLYYSCVLPPGRDKLFTPNNIPGVVPHFKVNVDIADDSPWQARLIPCSPADKEEISKIIDNHLELDLIEDGSGPFASACILVRKKSGRNKIACCLTTLNARCRKNTYPVPLIRDNLDCLADRPFQTTIDVCGGYNSMVIKEADRDYFAFITHRGLFRWKRPLRVA